MPLNGWHRLWIVISVVWVLPVALWSWAIGLPTLYTPPKHQQVFEACQRNTLPADVRDWFSKNVSKLKTDDWFAKNDMVPIEVSTLENDRSPLDVCTHNTILTFNPKTKALQLPVFARLGPYDMVLHGYDLDSAIGKEVRARLERSQWERRNAVARCDRTLPRNHGSWHG